MIVFILIDFMYCFSEIKYTSFIILKQIHEELTSASYRNSKFSLCRYTVYCMYVIVFQAHGWQSEGRTVHVPFPLETTTGNKTFMFSIFDFL
jgi:hypothetical protein